MKKYIGHIILLAAVLLSLASCAKREKVIPRRTMSRIYASMCMADQWLDRNPEYRKAADTTDFYGSIFKAYGYDYDDFRRSVDHYLQDPERYSKMVRQSTSMLKKRAKLLSENVDYIEESRHRRELSFEIAPKPIYYDTLFLKATLTDSIDMKVDKRGLFLPERIVLDTSYYGPHMFVKEPDTLSVQSDSTLVEEEVVESMLIDPLRANDRPVPREKKAPLVKSKAD